MDDLNRDIAKFYDKIYQGAHRLGSSSKSTNCNRISNTGNTYTPRSGGIFGEVTKKEIENVLKTYDERQNDARESTKPLACDENIIKGGSYAKMLYAKPGFHHLGSTEHLIKVLGIDEHTRSSFLGDYNSYAVAESEDLDGIKRKYLKETTKKIIEAAYQHLNKDNMSQAKELIEQALKLDHKSGEAKIAKGLYHDKQREYEMSAREFKEALECENVDKKQVGLNLSNSLFQLGMGMYHRAKWERAATLFGQSLEADPENSGAKLHLELSRDKLRDLTHRQSSFRPVPPRHRG